MASRGSLLLSTAVLLAAAAAAAGLSLSAPPYCVPGQRVPQFPLPTCRWYVASRTCGFDPTPYLPPAAMLKERCCGELAAVAPECRCKALREMMDQMSVRPEMIDQQKCWHAQAVFAATVVTEPECGLRTIHGAQFCDALSAEN